VCAVPADDSRHVLKVTNAAASAVRGFIEVRVRVRARSLPGSAGLHRHCAGCCCRLTLGRVSPRSHPRHRRRMPWQHTWQLTACARKCRGRRCSAAARWCGCSCRRMAACAWRGCCHTCLAPRSRRQHTRWAAQRALRCSARACVACLQQPGTVSHPPPIAATCLLQTPALLRHVGAYLARVDAALSTFSHPGTRVTHDWCVVCVCAPVVCCQAVHLPSVHARQPATPAGLLRVACGAQPLPHVGPRACAGPSPTRPPSFSSSLTSCNTQHTGRRAMHPAAHAVCLTTPECGVHRPSCPLRWCAVCVMAAVRGHTPPRPTPPTTHTHTHTHTPPALTGRWHTRSRSCLSSTCNRARASCACRYPGGGRGASCQGAYPGGGRGNG
jgi:hypothetical protein